MAKAKKQKETTVTADLKKYVVVSAFRDIKDFSIVYNAGDELPEGFSEERIQNLLNLKLIELKQ